MSAAQIVIAVDGPSGSGKSTAARAVADRLGLRYLDTGAMYRALTWWTLQAGALEPAAIEQRLDEPDIDVGTDPLEPTITVDGRDVATEIRSSEVTGAVSQVSAISSVRERMVAMQHAFIGDGGIVVEGRDIGTVVAPDADLKLFLTADPAERARRRNAEQVSDQHVEVHATEREMARRDQADSSRAVSPTTKAPDAIELDTTALDLGAVVARVVELAEQIGQADPA